jgi:hypothetical protein
VGVGRSRRGRMAESGTPNGSLLARGKLPLVGSRRRCYSASGFLFFCEKCFWIPVVGELGTQRIFWILGKILCYYRASRSSVRSFHLPRKAMQHLCSEGKLRGGEEESGVSQAVFLDDVYMLKDGVHDCIVNLPDLSFDFGENKLAEYKWTQS